jgi:hypothetical protein
MNRTTKIVSALLAVIVALGTLVTALKTTDENEPSKPATVTITVNEAPNDGAPTVKITVPKQSVKDAATGNPDLKQHDETPPGTSEKEIAAVKRAADLNRKLTDPLPTAGASAGFQGCVTRFVRNQSGRGGIRPQWQVLHYTVSRNVSGWSDVNAIVALFDRSSAQASSNFVIDAEGHCAYIVPIESKSWTQAAANPFSVSYEIINSGSESTFMGAAGYARLKSVMTQVKNRTGIPLRAGTTRGCAPGSSGIVQHFDFGTCGGGHHDIKPFSKTAVIKAVSGPTKKPVTPHAKKLCQELNRARKSKKFTKRSTAVKKALVKAHYVCRYGPPGSIVRR